MQEPRFLLDEDSVCYGCEYFIGEVEIGIPVPEENLTCGGTCDCNMPCIDGSMNDYDDMLKDKSFINFINSIGTAAKTINPGEQTTILCDCGGTLTVGKSGNNGHIHAHCDKCDRALIQ